MDRYEGKRIFITGAGSGIGQATALRLLSEGGTVIGADVNADGLTATSDMADAAGLDARLDTVVLDIADEAMVGDVVGQAIATLGGLDVLVNAAGILEGTHTHESSLDQWNRVIGVNLTGTFLVTRAALPVLLETGNGVIVNFGSTAGSFGHPYLAAYAASKGGIEAMTHALATEYSGQGLRAVTVTPGGIKSGITDAIADLIPADTDWSKFAKAIPLLSKGSGRPADVAGVVAMVASADGAFITGTEIRIDGGAHA